VEVTEVFRRVLPTLVVSLVSLQPVGMRAQPQDAVAFVNATVVATTDGTLARGVTVVVRGGRIESVAAGAPPAGIKTLDVGGRYVVPGLVDAHTHITGFRALRTALESGVTTARSSGVSSYVDVGMRELVKQGALPGPDILAAGYHIRPIVADEAFMDHPALAPLMRGGMTTVDALRRMVQANLGRGVDWIKVLASERAGTPETDPRKQVYTDAELAVVVEEAGRKNVPVQAHAHGAEGALAAVKAGVRSLEHGTYLTDEALKLMAEKGTFFVPTFATVIDVAEPGGDYDNRDLRLRGAHMLPRLEQTIKRAHQLGVRIVTGADTSYGPNSLTRVSREAAEFVRMGLPPLVALQAATSTAAQLLRLENQIGRVAPGFEADLLVVEANPLDSIVTLQDPLLVMSNGRVVVDRLRFGK
jgi:imidazolonepropionase-like amidohydrolase